MAFGGLSAADLNFSLHLPDLVFNSPVDRMFAQWSKVGILRQPAEIRVSKQQRLFQRGSCTAQFTIKRVTACQIVEHQRIAWFEPREAFVHFKAVLEFAPLRIVVAQDLKRFHVLWVAPDNPFEKAYFDIKIPRFLARALLGSSTTFLRHTTRRILPKRHCQVKCTSDFVQNQFPGRQETCTVRARAAVSLGWRA